VIIIFADHPDDRHHLLRMAESAPFCGTFFAIINPTVTYASAKGDLVVLATTDILVPISHNFAQKLAPSRGSESLAALGEDVGWSVVTFTATASKPFQFTPKSSTFVESCGTRICDGFHKCTDPDKCLASGATKLPKFALASEIKFPTMSKHFYVESTSFARIFCSESFISATKTTGTPQTGTSTNCWVFCHNLTS
jgi:hypothetical protein